MSHMTPKPRKGSARASQRARARLAKTRERAAKDAAKLQTSGGWPDEYYSERKQQYVRVTK